MTEQQPPPPTPPGAPAADPAGPGGGGGGYRVALPTFEGPLDLLLHLIEEHELDIRDIPIAFVAQKYVEYITLMDAVNIDVASEYLVMAATLAHIKSVSLLPIPPPVEDEDEDAELDPRAELIRRLLEYQKYKHAAEQLGSHDVLGRDVFGRGMPAPAVDGPAQIAGLNLFKLLDAFQNVLSRAKATIDHQIDFERFSITDRINELSDLLRVRPRLSFDELFDAECTRAELIVTFLALLEMTRLRMTRLYQEGALEMIFVELSVSGDDAQSVDDTTDWAGNDLPSPERGAASADGGEDEASSADGSDDQRSAEEDDDLSAEEDAERGESGSPGDESESDDLDDDAASDAER
jgi:segregation and condensation protein A